MLPTCHPQVPCACPHSPPGALEEGAHDIKHHLRGATVSISLHTKLEEHKQPQRAPLQADA